MIDMKSKRSLSLSLNTDKIKSHDKKSFANSSPQPQKE